MTDMACSPAIHSARGARERTLRIASDALPFLAGGMETTRWINWPIFLSSAKTLWKMTEKWVSAALDPLVEASEVVLTMKPLLVRLTHARWAPAIPTTQPSQPLAQLQAFQTAFETITS